jgi:putative PIG3 family NAD(P)H quinone oxidoreductase
MKFLKVVPSGEGYVASLEETATPVPGPGELLVRVAASGVNRADLSQIAGRYPPPPGESEILGMEISGTVVGSGEKICALLSGGGDAEYTAVPEGQIFPSPSRLDLVHAAGIPEAHLTAYLNLVVEGGLAEKGRALVHAGASGVGLAAIQTAKFLGASAAATTRSASKLSALRSAGADVAIDSGEEDFAEAIERAWGENAVDVVLDPVGAATFSADLRVLAPGGRIIFLATMSGAKVELDIAALMGKRARLVGSTLRSRSRRAKSALVARFRREILPGFEAGRLSVAVDSVYPPERAAEAFARMKRNENVGKILIDWTGNSHPSLGPRSPRAREHPRTPR